VTVLRSDDPSSRPGRRRQTNQSRPGSFEVSPRARSKPLPALRALQAAALEEAVGDSSRIKKQPSFVYPETFHVSQHA
jgi:hypothetical protein